jgi:sugar transferase (PEP-CTERM system associated)
MIIARWVFFANLVFLLFFLVSWRFLYSLVIRKKLFTEKAILVGSGELARDVLNEIAKKKDLSYDVRSVIVSEKDREHEIQAGGMTIYHGFDNICDVSQAENVSSVIVALDERRSVLPHEQLLACKMRGINVIDGVSFYERITEKLLVEKINPSWLIFSDGFARSRISRATKRMIGLLISTLMLVLFSPIISLVVVAIKLDSQGPILFLQERVGQYGKTFKLYKFRSMRNNAEKGTGPVWAEREDPRTTRVGKIIRKLRIDELPQLWNVFKGDMSFVGPRPERPFFVENLKKTIPYYNERTSVKPGVTGWAQIKYPYGASQKGAVEKLKYDLYYIKNMSIVMDLIVIFHTVKIVLLGKGSR